MKFKIISGILALSIALTAVIIICSCSDSNSKKTESTDQEESTKDSSEDTVFELQQPTSELAINTESSEESTLENENTEFTASIQEDTPPAAKEKNTTKNDINPSGTSKTTSKPTLNETAETVQAPENETSQMETKDEQAKVDTPIPAKVVDEKEEPKVTIQSQPVPEPEPSIEEIKEVIDALPVKEEPKVVIDTIPPKENTEKAEAAPGNWIVPQKDKNRANPIKADSESIKIGKSLYRKHCASCHGKKGLGDGSKAAQLDTPSGDFTLPSFQNQSDGVLFYKSWVGKGDMPNYKKKIPDEEDIWHIVNYMRTFK